MNELRTRPRKEPVVRFETPPGLQSQMDWAVYEIDFLQEGRRRVNLFGYLLSYSRREYLHFTAQQDFDTTIRQHIRAFEYLKGVAATCLYDCMKVVVQRWEDDQPIYNPRFLAFATHYGYRPRACRPRRPQTKGKVERQFDYVEKNLLNGRTFRSLEHLNEVTRWWLANVADTRVHRKTKKRPIDAYQEELPHLLSLPRASLRYLSGHLPRGGCGRIHSLPQEPVFGTVALDRHPGAGATDRRYAHGLQRPY